MPHKVVLISDPGIDGAFAVALALNDPDLEVVGLLATAGNVSAEQATKNIHILVDHIDPPRLALGSARPRLSSTTSDGKRLHGPFGLGGTDFPCATLHHLPPSEKLLVDVVRQHPHERDGHLHRPADRAAPRLRSRSRNCRSWSDRIVVIGGGSARAGQCRPGQRIPLLLRSAGRPTRPALRRSVTLVPLDVMRKVLFAPTDLLDWPARRLARLPFPAADRALRHRAPHRTSTASKAFT